MAQNFILAPAATAATSTDIVVAAGAVVTVGIYSAAGGILPSGVDFTVYQDTPDGDNYVARLSNFSRTTALSGPGTYRVKRPAYTGTAFGVFTEA